MEQMRQVGIRIVGIGWMLVVVGCLPFRQSTGPVHYYRLGCPTENRVKVHREKPAFRGCLLIVRPQVAAYLNRPGLAIRRGDQGVVYTENHRWAEPVEDGLHRLLRECLSRRLGTEHILVGSYPVAPSNCWELQIVVDQFEIDEHGVAYLAGTWTLLRGADREVLMTVPFYFQSSFSYHPSDLSPAVQALAQDVEKLSDQISEKLFQRLRSSSISSPEEH